MEAGGGRSQVDVDGVHRIYIGSGGKSGYEAVLIAEGMMAVVLANGLVVHD